MNEAVLTTPTAVPALGRGVNVGIEPARWTCWLKNDVSSPRSRIALRDRLGVLVNPTYWLIGTRSTHGYRNYRRRRIHLLLSVGVFLIIYRIVVRGTPGVDTTTKKR